MEGGGRAGPSPDSENLPSHLVVGRILAPHGVKGEVEVEILTDFPDRFSSLKTVCLGEALERVVLEGHRPRNNRLLLKLGGYEGREQAATLRGKLIYVPLEEAMPLEEDEYYLYQVLGLQVWTTEGEFLGRVDEVLSTRCNDVYLVSDGAQEVLIPAISSVVKEVDLDGGRLIVRLMEGLR